MAREIWGVRDWVATWAQSPKCSSSTKKEKLVGELPSIPMGIIGHGVLDGLGGYLEVSPLVIIENHKEMV